MKISNIVIGGLFIISCIGLGLYNLFENPDFFITPLSTIVSICIAVVVSYFFVQKKTDDRRKKEKIDKLVYKIQEMILKENFIKSDDQNLIIQRSVANKIAYLETYVDKELKEEIDKVKNKFEEFREFYCDHYKDAEYMKKSRKQLLSYVSLIDDFCDSIHMKLL